MKLRAVAEPRRFQMRRTGLIGLYEYDDETFEFEDGRLLLRGPNGAGKSKALELTLPLLLDGELRPERLDPFGGSGRSMRWNLLGDEDGGRPTGLGYSWLELERVAEDGSEQWVTLVLGVSANRNDRDVRSWFAILEASRPAGEELRGVRLGHGASLVCEGAPISRGALAELAGEVIDGAAAYRRRVNALLFEVPEERYEAIVRLLLSLRKPQLSKSLDPAELSARLTEALPELDRDSVLRVSARLDDLDRIRRELGELREVSAAVSGFTGVYRDWARASLRERGQALRLAIGRRQRAEVTVSEAVDTREQAIARGLALQERQRECEVELAEARGAREELRSSEDWREAERLDELARLAAEAAAELAESELALRRADQERERQAAALASSRDAESEASEGFRAAGLGALESASRAGIGDHAAIVEGLAQRGEPRRDLSAVRGLLRERASARASELAELGERAERLAGAERELERSRERFEAAEDAQRERARAREQASGRLEEIRDGLIDLLDGWLGRARVLDPSDQLAAELEEALGRAGSENAPARRIAAAAADRRASALADRGATLGVERAGFEAELEPLRIERAELEAERDPVPDPLAFRTADRADRAGAPLWSLVDFKAEVADEVRAGLEGALEGAGLLDAWVMADGQLIDVDDALLVAAPNALPGPTLVDSLAPLPNGPVAAKVVESVLGSIGRYAEARPVGESAAAPWIAADGSFALGPLRGRRRVEQARFIGARARAENRARRLTELAAQIEPVEAAIARIDLELGACREQRSTLEAELVAFPDERPAVMAHTLLTQARREEVAASQRTGSEQEAMARAAERRELTHREGLAYARERGLPRPEDRGGARQVEVALAAYREHCAELIAAAVRVREVGDLLAAQHQAVERAASGLDTASTRRTEATRIASRRRGAHAQVEAALGDSVEQLRGRLGELAATIEAREQEVRRGTDERVASAAASARADAAAENAGAELSAAAAEVDRSHAALGRLAALGGWGLALGEEAPEGHQEAAGWSAERALAALAEIPRKRLATRGGLEGLIQGVDNGADELRHRLGGTEFAVERRRLPEDLELAIVEVRHGGALQPISSLESWLLDELEARERTIAEGDRKLFESFLVGGLADQLRERITGAAQLVATMNASLASCVTSSGLSIELEWRPREAVDPGLREATRLLQRSIALLRDDDRAQLVEFLRRRIEEARQARDHGSTAEHVMSALDYRAWHEFCVVQIRDGRRERLTRQRHQRGSGGEKAVALHLPLFAAAAAQFGSAAERAPRLILLDEALAGIDEKMRAQLLGLLGSFDLDFVMTSHEMWGCYPEVSALGIYHLHREPGLPGVATAHFRWDGKRRVEVERVA